MPLLGEKHLDPTGVQPLDEPKGPDAQSMKARVLALQLTRVAVRQPEQRRLAPPARFRRQAADVLPDRLRHHHRDPTHSVDAGRNFSRPDCNLATAWAN